ncbi:MAG: glycosyltransferase family 2 protein, partial [bacterium]
MPAPLTVVIPTLNEASQIADCVRGVGWADEVIVADGGSNDRTPEVAQSAGAMVLQGPWTTIAAQRNGAIAAAKHEWILAVDADERVGADLAREIAAVIADPAHDAYAVRRRNAYLGRTITHAGWGSDWVVRVFKRSRRFVERRVHEHLERATAVGRLRAPLDHVPYRDLSHHLAKLDRYAAWGARDLADRGRRAR